MLLTLVGLLATGCQTTETSASGSQSSVSDSTSVSSDTSDISDTSASNDSETSEAVSADESAVVSDSQSESIEDSASDSVSPIAEYTVTFVYGDKTTSTQTITEGEKVSNPGDDTTVADSRFDGWFAGDSLYDFDSPVTSDLTLTSHYTLFADIEFTVTYSLYEQYKVSDGFLPEELLTSTITYGKEFTVLDAAIKTRYSNYSGEYEVYNSQNEYVKDVNAGDKITVTDNLTLKPKGTHQEDFRHLWRQ